MRPNHVEDVRAVTEGGEPHIFITLFGSFNVLVHGRSVAVRSGGKTESLLYHLALRNERGVQRELLLHALWPDTDEVLASQALHSLVYSLHRQFGDAIDGTAPVVLADGYYRLNAEAGVTVDVVSFESLVGEGDRQSHRGAAAKAVDLRTEAVSLYKGDLYGGRDVYTILERERLRAMYLRTLAHLADHYFDQGEYAACLRYALLLLEADPCREDAHRLVMRCHVRQGERAQALRQYRLCEHLLRTEFDATPEPTTTSLFDQVRCQPGSV